MLQQLVVQSWFIWLILNIVITLILLSQTRNYQLRRQDFIRKINDEAENSLNATLDNMPIGVIRFNNETFEPEWFNPFIDMIFKGNDKVINRDDIKKIFKKQVMTNISLLVSKSMLQNLILIKTLFI